MANLINITDFTENKFLTQNLDSSDIDPVIAEAQMFDLKPVLGDALFHDMMENFTVAKYVNLLDGQTYTPTGATSPIRFSGLKMVLKYYVYARLITDDGIKSTNSGFVRKTLENSERITDKDKALKVAQSRSGAKVYEDEMVKYLNNYSTTYPLWGCDTVRKNKGWGFRMRAV